MILIERIPIETELWIDNRFMGFIYRPTRGRGTRHPAQSKDKVGGQDYASLGYPHYYFFERIPSLL